MRSRLMEKPLLESLRKLEKQENRPTDQYCTMAVRITAVAFLLRVS